MGGCTAINCSNHSRKGFRMARFPKNEERRKKWVINMRRENWQPGPSAQICLNHFEDSQFESKDGDVRSKLKSDAVPTLFDVPNKPCILSDKRQKGVGCPKPGSILEKIATEKVINIFHA